MYLNVNELFLLCGPTVKKSWMNLVWLGPEHTTWTKDGTLFLHIYAQQCKYNCDLNFIMLLIALFADTDWLIQIPETVDAHQQ